MDVIFDLEKESTDWASEINWELKLSFAVFFAEPPHISTSEW